MLNSLLDPKQKLRSRRKNSAKPIRRTPIIDWASAKAFSFVHRSNLIYNTCWEDPRLDRAALKLGPYDTILVITSAGCNALDYALDGPRRIYAVDVNPRQNALMELKLAAIRRLDHTDFFRLFGLGRMSDFNEAYHDVLREELTPWTRQYWDKRTHCFSGERSFYFHGSSGKFAQLMNFYVDRVAKVRPQLETMFNAASIDEQREIYESQVRKAFWTPLLKRVISSEAALAMLGVPRPQRQQVELHYGRDIAEFVEMCIETVFARLTLHDNYFWRVYLFGEYTPECCPEYLKPENFARLKNGLIDKIRIHSNTVEGFLRATNARISRYVLLDHMDWLSTFRYAALKNEWQAIVDRAASDCRVIFRSGGMQVEYVDPIQVQTPTRQRSVGNLLDYDTALAATLHKRCRVHTYGSFYIADLNVF